MTTSEHHITLDEATSQAPADIAVGETRTSRRRTHKKDLRIRQKNAADGAIRIEKQKIFYRGYFIAQRMFESISAMEIAMECHTGTRKDGFPEVSHQFEIVGMILQVFEGRICTQILDSLVAAGFLHDVPEDYSEKYPLDALAAEFSETTMSIVTPMTKPADFEKTHEHRVIYYGNISKNILAVFGKSLDRIHNLLSMIAGFSAEKQRLYIEETETYFFPMIKQARREHPQFYMILTLLKQQMEMIIRLYSYNLQKED